MAAVDSPAAVHTSPPPRVRLGAQGPQPTAEILGADGAWRRVHSAYDPQREADAWLDHVLAGREPQTLLLIGAGLGFVVDAAERRKHPARLVILEPEPEMARLLLERRQRAGAGSAQVTVLTGPHYTGASELARTLPHADRGLVAAHPVVERCWPDDVRRAREIANTIVVGASANAAARRVLGRAYLLQTLSNAARIAREGDCAALRGVAAGHPIVVVGAGPSLDTDVHHLYPLRDRAVVIACDTAARPLVTVGIHPDVIVALDPSRTNAAHLAGLPDLPHSWLAAEGSVFPSAFADFAGRTFFFRVANHHPWPWLQRVGIDAGVLTVWGSVLTAAFDLARQMSGSPILFAGADLAFTGNHPYCRGTIFEAQWAQWTTDGTSYPEIWAGSIARWPHTVAADRVGALVRTAPHLISFRDWLVEQASHTQCPVINTSAGGILVGPDIAQRSLGEALRDAPPVDREKFAARLHAAHEAAPDRRRSLFSAIDGLTAAPDHLAFAAWSEFIGTSEDEPEMQEALNGPEYTAWRMARRGRGPERAG